MVDQFLFFSIIYQIISFIASRFLESIMLSRYCHGFLLYEIEQYTLYITVQSQLVTVLDAQYLFSVSSSSLNGCKKKLQFSFSRRPRANQLIPCDNDNFFAALSPLSSSSSPQDFISSPLPSLPPLLNTSSSLQPSIPYPSTSIFPFSTYNTPPIQAIRLIQFLIT